MSAAPALPLRTRLGRLDAGVVAGAVVAWGVPAASDPGARPGVLAAVLAVFVAAWFAFGRRSEGGRSGWWAMVLVTVAVSAVGALESPAFATFQIIAFPLAWLLPPTFALSLVVNAGITVAVGVGYALGASLPSALGIETVSLGFSIAMGVWISGIERRSDERQELVDRLTAAQAQVAALSRDAGTVAERERLALELHDTLAQSLTAIVMLAERARSRHPADPGLDVLEDAAREALAEARALVTVGAKVPLEGGFAAALETLAARFRREAGLAVAVDVRLEVPRGLEVVLLRCAQEGLANVRKHADARSVTIIVAGSGGDAELSVSDDGDGPGGGGGFGITGMRDRVGLVGGTVDLVPGAEGGSRLVVRVPVREEAPR